MTGTGSTPSNRAANGGGSTSPPRGRKAGTNTNGHRLVGAVGWSILIMLGGLLVFYGWRTGANNQSLSQRNLRELDRIARAVEGRAEGFADGMQGWYEVYKAAQREETDALDARTASFRKLVPNLLDAPEECDAAHPAAVVSQRRVRFCFALRDTAAVDTTRLWWRGDFALDSLKRALRSDVFDATFLVDDSMGVFLASSGPAGSIRPRPHGGLAGLRLQDIPADTGRDVGLRVSTVRTVSIAGRDYRLFLQPLDVQPPRGEKTDTGATGMASVRWSAGGLVSTSRFRAESLALDTPHLIFLGLLLVLAILALPFLRAALMGQAESIKTVDVYLLSLSLVFATGILGIAVADIRFFGPYARSLDENLAVASGRVATALRQETRAALNELDRWWPAGSPDLRSDTLIFRDLPVSDDRYVHLQMLIWIDSAGEQRAKLTPRASNTALINVADRDYFRRIRDDRSHVHPHDQRRYYLESIRSRNTGEKIAMLSAPVCPPLDGASCRDTATLAVKAMTTRLASLDLPLLPPGVRFAVVRGDGVTLFHSDPERNLEENFLEETGDDGQLHALFAAWDSGHVRTSYMGRRSRIHVRPLEGTGTDSLALVLVLDDGLPGTTHFESIFLSLSGFLAWVIVLLTAFLVVELLLPGRLRWAWPDHKRPWKYPALTGLLLCFGALLVAQALIAARFRVPVEPGSFLVPVQALSVALLIQSIGLSAPGRAWRNPRIIGWTVFGTAAVLQFGLAAGSPAALPHAWLLRAAQIAMALLAAAAVVSMRRLAHDDQDDVPREPRRRGQKRAAVVLEPWYVATIVATLATTAFLPAFLFHQEALTRQTHRLIQYEQLKLREGLREREHRIRMRTPQLGLAAGYDSILVRDTLDLAVPPVLGATAGRTPARCRGIDADLHVRGLSVIERRMPFITSAAVEMRQLGPGSGGMRLETCDGGLIHLAGTLPDGANDAVGDRFRISAVPGYGPVSAARLLALLGILIAGAAIVAGLARWLGRRVFLLDLPRYAPLNLLSHVTADPLTGRTSVIAICKGSMVRSPLEDDARLRYVDLLDYAGKDSNLNREMEIARGQQKLLVLDHFDHHLDDPEWRDRLLLALEDHVAVRRARVVLMTSREPCTLFPLLEGDGGTERPTTERWVRLLGRFVDVAVADIAGQATGSVVRTDAPNAPGPQREAARLVPAGDTIESDPGDGTGSSADGVSAAHAAEVGESAARRAASGAERGPAGEARGDGLGDPDSRAEGPGTAWAPHAIDALLDRASHYSARFVANSEAASARAKRTLFDESDGRPRLEEVARHVELRSDFHSLTPDAVAEQVRDMADSYYHSLWNILDHEERLVVTQLAYGVVVNPNGRPAVRRLLARRVLVRRPELRLMNESFRRFVREEVPASIIESWERATPASHWQRLRFPLGLGLVAVVAFLFVTQRTAFDSAMALVTAAGVGTTAILKLLGAARWPGRSE